jgi:AcrR family transcriptional regulator
MRRIGQPEDRGTLCRRIGGLVSSRTEKKTRGASAGEGPTVAASRREEILAIAASIFARQGIASTTVRDIGEEAGILSGSLYHHFASKDDIVEEIIRAALDPDIELDVALANSTVEPLEAVRQLLVRSLRFSHDHANVAAIIANSRHELLAAKRFDFLHARGAKIRASWIAVLERGMAEGVFRADLDPDITYKAVMGAVTALPNWYRPSGPRSIEDIAEVFVRLFVCGIAADRSRPRARQSR